MNNTNRSFDGAQSHSNDLAIELAELISRVALNPAHARACGDAFYAIANVMEHTQGEFEQPIHRNNHTGSLLGGPYIDTVLSTPVSTTLTLIDLGPTSPTTQYPTTQLPSTSAGHPPAAGESDLEEEEEDPVELGSEPSFLRGLPFHVDAPPVNFTGIWRIGLGYDFTIPSVRPLRRCYIIIRGSDVGIFCWWSEIRPLLVGVPHNLYKEAANFESAKYELEDAICRGYAAVIR